MKYKLDGREVEIEDTDFDGDAVYILAAYYLDTDEDLTDEELNQLSDKYQNSLFEDVVSARADHYYEMYKDE